MDKLPIADALLGEVAAKMTEEAVTCNVAKKRRPANKLKLKLDDRLKPIMTPETELQVNSAMAMYEHKDKWKQWGLEYLRGQGASILLHGPPGTGKSVIAEYMAARVNKGLLRMNMKDVGGKAPGHTERAVAQLFGDARAQGNHTVYIDECEAMLWDRSRAGSDSMWMVGVIDELLMQISKYKGLVILATNHFEILDSALVSRMLCVVKIASPEFPERKRLWIQKMPERFPLKLTMIEVERLAEIALTGREIENAIIKCASECIVANIEPTFEHLCNVAKSAA